MHERVQVSVAGGDRIEALVEDLGRLEISRSNRVGDLYDRAHRRSH
jgi:hypothetical protein